MNLPPLLQPAVPFLQVPPGFCRGGASLTLEGLADAAAVEIDATLPIEPITAMKRASILLRINVSPFGSCERSSEQGPDWRPLTAEVSPSPDRVMSQLCEAQFWLRSDISSTRPPRLPKGSPVTAARVQPGVLHLKSRSG